MFNNQIINSVYNGDNLNKYNIEIGCQPLVYQKIN